MVMRYGNRTMARKVFIVRPGEERLYRALQSALANEPDVQIFYDRRDGASPSTERRGEERRVAPDVRDQIRDDGFAVVRPGLPPPARNVRWA
jgi:hypothetical protein